MLVVTERWKTTSFSQAFVDPALSINARDIQIYKASMSLNSAACFFDRVNLSIAAVAGLEKLSWNNRDIISKPVSDI